jgi:IS5 family transposase
VQETDREIAENGENVRAVAAVDEAGILRERNILGAAIPNAGKRSGRSSTSRSPIGDSLVSRQFCRVYWEAVLDDATLFRWVKLIGPQTLERVNERVAALARSLRVTRGRKLRVDGAVVETNIHHPTGSGLLGAELRVLSRLLRRAKTLVGDTPGLAKAVFQSHNRSVRRLTQQRHRVARRKGEEAVAGMKGAYAKLLAITQRTQTRARAVCVVLQGRSEGRAQRLVQQVEQVLPRIDRAIAQAVRRVIDGLGCCWAETGM